MVGPEGKHPTKEEVAAFTALLMEGRQSEPGREGFLAKVVEQIEEILGRCVFDFQKDVVATLVARMPQREQESKDEDAAENAQNALVDHIINAYDYKSQSHVFNELLARVTQGEETLETLAAASAKVNEAVVVAG